MAEITSPKDYFREVDGVEAYVNAVSEWHKLHKIEERRFQSEVWFRGAGKVYEKPLEPGVYRADFTKRAKNYHMGSEEERRPQSASLVTTPIYIAIPSTIRCSLRILLG